MMTRERMGKMLAWIGVMGKLEAISRQREFGFMTVIYHEHILYKRSVHYDGR